VLAQAEIAPFLQFTLGCKDFQFLPSKITRTSHQFQALAEEESVNTDHVALTLCMEGAAPVEWQAAPRGCGAPLQERY
jgi:hypothetical protein